MPVWVLTQAPPIVCRLPSSVPKRQFLRQFFCINNTLPECKKREPLPGLKCVCDVEMLGCKTACCRIVRSWLVRPFEKAATAYVFTPP